MGPDDEFDEIDTGIEQLRAGYDDALLREICSRAGYVHPGDWELMTRYGILLFSIEGWRSQRPKR